MALTTPILYTTNAFDASLSHVFSFNVIGGNQVVGSTLTIKNNSTLAVVYTGTQMSFRFEYILPEDTLSNGTYYQATLTTKDVQGNDSSESAPIQFYCFSTPTFEFTNIPKNNIITNSGFSFDVRYNQIQGETLNAYVFNLYSTTGALISTSSTQYNTSGSLSLTISYLFSGFEDNTVYYIEADGVTTNGMQISTGRIQFIADYISPDIFSLLSLTNNCKGGYVTIKSNVIEITGVSSPYPPTYIDNNEVDLRQSRSFVKWDNSYTIRDTWTMRLWGREFGKGKNIITFSTVSGDTITIYYNEDGVDAWFEARVVHFGDFWGYVEESQHIDKPTNEEQIFCWFRRIGNIYELKIENRGVVA